MGLPEGIFFESKKGMDLVWSMVTDLLGIEIGLFAYWNWILPTFCLCPPFVLPTGLPTGLPMPTVLCANAMG
jgi:hypothetical protein